MKLSVIYESEEVLKDVDIAIKMALESVGFQWYGQGFELGTNRRDMAFDFVPENIVKFDIKEEN